MEQIVEGNIVMDIGTTSGSQIGGCKLGTRHGFSRLWRKALVLGGVAKSALNSGLFPITLRRRSFLECNHSGERVARRPFDDLDVLKCVRTLSGDSADS